MTQPADYPNSSCPNTAAQPSAVADKPIEDWAGYDAILSHFPHISAVQQGQFRELEYCYNHWNKRINLVSRKDITQLYTRHVLHSLSVAKLISFRAGTAVLDVGTGGGFPGLPLAILFPKVQFCLVDPVGKKITAVQGIVEYLGLRNVAAYPVQAVEAPGKYDFVVARAVTDLATVYKWVRRKLKLQHNNSLPNGLLYLRGPTTPAMLDGLDWNTAHCCYPIADSFADAFFATKYLVHVYPKGP